jgi:CubicO group peptidase (beta-lactamase class C family)
MANRPLPTPPIDGHCDARFVAMRDAFAANFVDEGEIGASVCVRLGDTVVVDLWGGHVDEQRTRAWKRDTLVNAYSVGKGVLTVLFLALVEQGRIDLDIPVAEAWPEFAAHGKGSLRVRGLMAHRAGLPAVREPLPEFAMYDWDQMCGTLAGQAPYWEPGRDHGYHCNTFGFLLGELVRRATGLSVSDALARHVTGPLDTEFYMGLPRREHPRVAEIVSRGIPMDDPELLAQAFPTTGDAQRDQMVRYTYFNPRGLSGFGTVNTEAWRLATIPSTNGHATARAVAAIYAAFLAGGPPGAGWAATALRAEATTVHSDGLDRVLDRPSRFGLGFQLSQPSRLIGRSPNAFGHYGYGGSVGFADPDAGLAFGYLMNHPGERWYNPRTRRLVEALYACL